MATVRFANPGSDLGRMVDSFRTIHAAAQDHQPFDLDFAVRSMVDRRQVSSGGAGGDEALRRSTRADRSRDPLYNQLKMYSEIYRMLGWLKPDGNQLRFRTTLLSDYLCYDWTGWGDRRRGRLVEESLLAVTFPNPNTANLGVANLRPFSVLLQLMDRLDGCITRDEMIFGLLGLLDDTVPNAIEDRAQEIARARGHTAAIARLVNDLASANDLQVNTLQNYTRFPIGALQDPIIAWAVSSRRRGLYERPLPVLQLTAKGRDTLGRLRTLRDVREKDLRTQTIGARAAFAIGTFYAMIERCGFDIKDAETAIAESEAGARPVLEGLGVGITDVLYSPWQQCDSEVLEVATGGSSR